MDIELYINGYFRLIPFHLSGKALTKKEKKLVLEQLQEGIYVIGMQERKIYNIDNLQKALFHFTVETSTALKYEFDEI